MITTTEEPATTTMPLPEQIDLLAQWMQREQALSGQVDAIRARYDLEASPLKQQLDDCSLEVSGLRGQIKQTMEQLGALTAGNDLIQIQRPGSNKWVIRDEEIALAHLADLERLHEVRRVTTDQAALVAIAKQLGGLDGVEQVVERGFKVVPVKQKKAAS